MLNDWSNKASYNYFVNFVNMALMTSGTNDLLGEDLGAAIL